MNLQRLYRDLPAIWLVFGHSATTHGNAPRDLPHDHRERSLLNLLIEYLGTQIASLDDVDQGKLIQLLGLLQDWSDDLTMIYRLRETSGTSLQFSQFRDRLFSRIHALQANDYAIIPNGLISEKDNGNHEHVCLAVLKSPAPGKIDWIQIDPGSPYHQRLQTAESLQSNCFLNIRNIDLAMISKEWLDLLIDLKAKHPGGYYKIVSLYECLLAQLNGETTFKETADDLFVPFSYESPVQRWEVIRETFHYLLAEFFGEKAPEQYHRFLVGFKQFLLTEVAELYEHPDNQQKIKVHVLLNEMCNNVAYVSLTYGTTQQQAVAVNLVEVTQAMLHKQLNSQYQSACEREQLGKLAVTSLSFEKPSLPQYTDSAASSGLSSSMTTKFYLLEKPKQFEGPFEYLERTVETFFGKLRQSSELHEHILFLKGVESFLLDYLIKTAIFRDEARPFTRDDTKFVSSIKQLGESYYSTVRKLVRTSGTGLEYQPQYYAKNIIIQFMVYAVIVALNRRHHQVGPLLREYDLSTAASATVSFKKIMCQLVIDDSLFLEASRVLKVFFAETPERPKLFSYVKFFSHKYEFNISNTADEEDEEVKFTYLLLQRDPEILQRFEKYFSKRKEEQYNRKWYDLAYDDAGDVWIPRLYFYMQTAAFIAKAALNGLYLSDYLQDVEPRWFRMTRSDYNYFQTSVSFDLHRRFAVEKTHEVNRLAYLLVEEKKELFAETKEDLYQRMIFSSGHLLENAVIATQHKKPEDLDAMTYLQLGSLQSQALLKIERLYITIKEGTLQFSNKAHAVLAKQTLFEFSTNGEYSCLERIARHNHPLFHRLGLLLVDKALSMKLRLIQHSAIGDLLEILLKLLPICPKQHQAAVRSGIDSIYQMLKIALANPSELQGYDQKTTSHTLAYLHAYLIMAIRAKGILAEVDVQIMLQTLVTLKKQEVLGIILDNTIKSQLYSIIIDFSESLISFVERRPSLLDQLMTMLLPEWIPGHSWQKEANKPCSYSCGDYKIEPLLGNIYFKGNSIKVVPFDMQGHPVYQAYFGQLNFAVMPGSHVWQGKEVDCYSSIDRDPMIRLTPVYKKSTGGAFRFSSVLEDLIIEAFINGQYHLYLPVDKLLNKAIHPDCLYHDSYNSTSYTHYQLGNTVLIMNKQHEVIYRWNLDTGLTIYSPKQDAYLVPFKQLLSPIAQSVFARVETPGSIEMYAKSISPGSTIHVDRLYFPRLQLTFQYKTGHYFSNEVYGYRLAAQQQLHTFKGFKGYLVLVKDQAAFQQTKIIVPHYQLKLATQEGIDLVKFDYKSVHLPAYFIYDVDAKLGLIKPSTVHANLYLALLHYMTASLDDHDMSACNGYHLAREYLEFAWQAKPYTILELDTLIQFLNEENMWDLHYQRIAIYLKVVSLLSYSLQFDFLYPDKSQDDSKKITAASILKDHQNNIIRFFAIYLRYKHRVLARIQLTVEEEQDVARHVFQEEEHAYTNQFRAYINVNLERSGEVALSAPDNKDYKWHYVQLFSQDQLIQTNFVDLFHKHMDSFKFTTPDEELSFSDGIRGILVDRFRLNHFFQLYTLAKSSVSRLQYRYLLHHVLLRAKHLDIDLPQPIIQMLGRALLLVSENLTRFPMLPAWIFASSHEYQLSKCQLTETEFLKAVRGFSSWYYSDTEDKKLWQLVCQHDLNAQQVPSWLPVNQEKFALQYERYTTIDSETKRDQIRAIFINAARNAQIRAFLQTVLTSCDQLKLSSQAGCVVLPVNRYHLQLYLSPQPLQQEPLRENPHYESLAIAPSPLIDLKQFFSIEQTPLEEAPFLFEAELEREESAYGQYFYEDFKQSWQYYSKQARVQYTWLNPYTRTALEAVLLAQAAQLTLEVSRQWQDIFVQFTARFNTEQGHQFSLAWFCGQVSHYHKGNILRVLLNPHQLSQLQPELNNQQENVIGKILSYLTDEIRLAQIRRALGFIDQMKELDDPRESEACLYQLVMTLSDSLDQDSYRYPNWLLFQFEHDLIIRDNQKALLLAMLTQPEKTMYQLNMGEGKSTVILPLLCAQLADASRILRVNVLFSLLTVMEGLLRQRLSTLLRTRLYMLPFFRDTDVSAEKLKILSKMLNSCRTGRGVLLVTPEHRMCLQLKARELSMLHDSDSAIQLALQELNAMPAMDLLDESDEILRHGTELNYAIGEKTSFDGHQLRWQMAQFFIKKIFSDATIKQELEKGKLHGFTDINEKQFHHGGVPYVLLLNEYFYNHHIKPILLERFLEAYKTLFQRYAVNGVSQLSTHVPYTLSDYMTGTLAIHEEKAILSFLEDKPNLRTTLLITKGLLSHGILFHIFNAPYRVKYGLNFIVGKKPVALPFIGKDIPSQRSEFSHPDIILGFTILSYLYQGLSKEQLKITLLELNMLFSQTVVNQQLQQWFEGSRVWIEKEIGSFPEKLTRFENLDLHNPYCLDQLHQCLQGNVDVILFYVNNCIFPNHAYQYRHKISANAHSIVGYHPALGFSGTDDRKITMPHGVRALRTDSQQGTDGKLLAVMTRTDNRQYVSIDASSTVELLQQFCEYVHRHPHCHILIDAGALVMGMDNYQVAHFLIERLPGKFKGIIYFSDQKNELTVLMSNGASILLAQCQLEKNSLFAYLDDIHTRGTDLKLPLNCRGILTVNIDMEKDKLMQAAMRLRNLAQQQSVILWGLNKVTAAIARDNHMDPSKIDSLAVIKWVTVNTISHIAHDLYFVALRKINFYLIRFAEKFLQNASLKLEALISRCREEELFSLQEFYGFSPQDEDLKQALYQFAERQIKELWATLESELQSKEVKDSAYYTDMMQSSQKEQLETQLQSICDETVAYLGKAKFKRALDTNEEKEVQVEVVQEEALIVSMKEAEPCEEKEWNFSMITRPGFIVEASQSNLIQPLRSITDYVRSLPELAHIVWHPNIYMTRNFIQTVQIASDDGVEHYLRLADVVLVHRSSSGTHCILLSGYEASELIRMKLYSSQHLLVHLKDVNGPTMLPVGSQVDKEAQKLLTISKLFNGECHYESLKEVKRLAKRLGRIYPDYFVNIAEGITEQRSHEIYGDLIAKGYLTASGTINLVLLGILTHGNIYSNSLDIGPSYQCHKAFVFKKLLALSHKLIIEKDPSLSQNQFTFWKWISVRQTVREYPGSALESVLNPERSIKL